jgi:hypothetical protein
MIERTCALLARMRTYHLNPLRGDISPVITVVVTLFSVAGCASNIIQDSSDTVSIVLATEGSEPVRDGRARFREIYCAVNADHGVELPDYRPCDEALTIVDPERGAPGIPVNLGPLTAPFTILMIPGLGADCFAKIVGSEGEMKAHAEKLGNKVIAVPVEGLASTARNAEIIRDAVMALPESDREKRVLLLVYSKGAPDSLAALATYPEVAESVAAVVSAAGAVGGSPLANDASQSTANLLASIPGSGCDRSDEGAVESLTTEFRKQWFATHQLPSSVAYYSIVTYPDQEHVSAALMSSFKNLGELDTRNDSQVIFNDQIIPGATLLGFINADHWAVAVPVARTHAIAGSTLLNRNAFPREVLLEAVIRFVDEDLATRSKSSGEASDGGKE